jgi:hypothetical protein
LIILLNYVSSNSFKLWHIMVITWTRKPEQEDHAKLD